MNHISQLVRSSNKLEIMKGIWANKDISYIPYLIYLSLTSKNNDEVQISESILYKFSQELPVKVKDKYFAEEKHTFVRKPSKINDILTVYKYSFCLYSQDAHTLPDDILIENLSIINDFFDLSNFTVPERMCLDIIAHVSMFLDTNRRTLAYEIINKTIKIADKAGNPDILVAANSILELFPL